MKSKVMLITMKMITLIKKVKVIEELINNKTQLKNKRNNKININK
jgi:hypothetical protein